MYSASAPFNNKPLMTQASEASPSLSVVIVSRDPWPALHRSLDVLHSQIITVGGEIIVGVSDRRAVPPDADRLYPAVTWLEERGASVFRLRALALSRCRGEIVAFTEDHAWVESDWCQTVLDAHAQHPEAAAIGGVVENEATRTLKDWVGFFVASGPFMRPICNGANGTISLQANVSYKRHALPMKLPELGLMAMTLHQELRERGAKLVADDRLVAYHIQELTLGGHSAGHFHNGRTIAAFRVLRMAPWLRPVRALGCFILPPVMLWRTVTAILGKRRYTRTLLLGLPLLVWFLCCHAAGELLGYLAGPGKSPQGVN